MKRLPSKYLEFIRRNARTVLRSGVSYERHHIRPKCLGGKDTKDNLCFLTARKHLKAHVLLAKLTEDSKCWHAVHMMCDTRRGLKTSMSVYARAKEEYRKRRSVLTKECWSDPNYRKKMSDLAKETWQDAKERERRVKAQKARWKDPELRKSVSDKMKDRWKNDESYRRSCNRGMNTQEDFDKRASTLRETLAAPEARALKRKLTLESWDDPVIRKKRSDAVKKNWEERRKKYGDTGRKVK